jgi:peptidoglycan/LPS O-acetylase OafA/YrhL
MKTEALHPPPVKLIRLEFLDALRGLAAFWVVVYHMLLLPEPDLVAPQWANLVAHNGGMGVTLFFVVSAFSLYYTMPLRLREPRPWVSFFVHRFFRIAPLFYLWIVLSLVRDRTVFGVDHGLREIAYSTAFVFNLVPRGQEGFVWASWTIGIEMLFYVLFPVYFLYARNRWQTISLALGLWIAWVAVQGLLPYFEMEQKTREMFLQWTFLRHLPVFACGALAYHVLLPNGEYRERPAEVGVALTVVAVAIFVALVNGWLPAVFGDLYYWQGLLFMLLLLGLGLRPLKLAVNTLTRYFGRVSYSMYLNHPTIVFLLAPVYAWIYSRGLGVSVSFLACLALTTAAVVAASEITYRLVELPGMRLGKKVNKMLSRRFAATTFS